MELILTKTLQALADPKRRKILQLLGERDLTVTEIADGITAEFGAITMPSVSHHLTILKNAQLVRAERSGQNIVYSLNASVVQEFLQQILGMFGAGVSNPESSASASTSAFASDESISEATSMDEKGKNHHAE